MKQELVSTNSMKPLLTLSSALFAGLGASITFVAVPAIYASKDPLTVWKTVYSRGARIAVPNLLISTGTGLACYVNSMKQTECGCGDFGYLLAAGLSFAVIPYTLLFMQPTNDVLMGSNEKTPPAEINRLINKWEKLQWFRTAVGAAVFVFAVYRL